MKICAYEVRPDEVEFFQQVARELDITVDLHQEVPSPETAHLAEGCTGVAVLGWGKIDAALLDTWKAMGVACLSTRTVGFNHIDVDHARKIGVRVCNVTYPPSGVAEYSVMMMLLCLRHYKQSLWRGQVNDFSLVGLEGRELGSLTVGIVGAGRIGQEVMRILQGFGCKILAYDPYPCEAVRELAQYVDLDTLYAQSDVISLHMPLSEDTFHLIDASSIAKMKDDVVLINAARGELIDTESLVEGIESGKIGALGLDVVEDEEGIAHVDHRTDILKNRQMAYLRQFKNVVMTQHMAFYTDVAVKSMVEGAVRGIVDMAAGKACATELGL